MDRQTLWPDRIAWNDPQKHPKYRAAKKGLALVKQVLQQLPASEKNTVQELKGLQAVQQAVRDGITTEVGALQARLRSLGHANGSTAQRATKSVAAGAPTKPEQK